MNYILQEKINDFWFDLYINNYDLCKKMLDVFKNKYKYKKYRIIEVIL